MSQNPVQGLSQRTVQGLAPWPAWPPVWLTNFSASADTVTSSSSCPLTTDFASPCFPFPILACISLSKKSQPSRKLQSFWPLQRLFNQPEVPLIPEFLLPPLLSEISRNFSRSATFSIFIPEFSPVILFCCCKANSRAGIYSVLLEFRKARRSQAVDLCLLCAVSVYPYLKHAVQYCTF